MLNRTLLLALAVGLAGTFGTLGCGNGASTPDPKTGGDGAKEGGATTGGATATGKKVEEGSKVCVSELLGVRYAIEDVLTESGLEVTGDCMFADVEIGEFGEAGAFELKYRAIGEEWQSCKSAADERTAFIRECADAIITTGSGGAAEGDGEAKDEG